MNQDIFSGGRGVLEIYLFTGGMGCQKPISIVLLCEFYSFEFPAPFPSSLDPCVANGLED